MTFQISSLVAVLASTLCTAAMAQPLKVPIEHDEDKGTVYVAPNVVSTETSATANGGTVGVQRPDGRGVSAGVDTSSSRPTYSVDGETGGNTSFSAGVHSDGDRNNGVKAGVTIKY